jgi:hypothetical protein
MSDHSFAPHEVTRRFSKPPINHCRMPYAEHSSGSANLVQDSVPRGQRLLLVMAEG